MQEPGRHTPLSSRIRTPGEAKFPIELPKGMAARHRLCTQMADKLKGLGYQGECGYNQLLYPSEATTRSILTFLVQKVTLRTLPPLTDRLECSCRTHPCLL